MNENQSKLYPCQRALLHTKQKDKSEEGNLSQHWYRCKLSYTSCVFKAYGVDYCKETIDLEAIKKLCSQCEYNI